MSLLQQAPAAAAAAPLDWARPLTIARPARIEFGVGKAAVVGDCERERGVTRTLVVSDAFNAGRPKSYTRRIGDPNIDFVNVQAGIYIQDDIRVRKGLTVTPGLRYEVQTHVKDFGNLGPRFGVTWAPFKNGKTTLRASWGIFYDWLTTNTYEQTLRVDGYRQQELNIVDPAYPAPSA